MPVYEYKCIECGEEWEAFNKVDARYNEICVCGGQSEILISSTAKPITYEYYSEALGSHITGPAQKKRIMKEKNCEEL